MGWWLVEGPFPQALTCLGQRVAVLSHYADSWSWPGGHSQPTSQVSHKPSPSQSGSIFYLASHNVTVTVQCTTMRLSLLCCTGTVTLVYRTCQAYSNLEPVLLLGHCVGPAQRTHQGGQQQHWQGFHLESCRSGKIVLTHVHQYVLLSSGTCQYKIFT
jgi:hypothetical protein